MLAGLSMLRPRLGVLVNDRADRAGAPPGGTLRVVQVAPERLAGWLARFADRHGRFSAERIVDGVALLAADGASARLAVPFPRRAARDPDPTSDPVTAVIEHALRERRVGALLVRRGGWAVGIFHGRRLTESKVGRGYVQGTTKAGGWSQQRYARRRDNQAAQAYESAAESAARLLLPRLGELEALVTGGDRSGVDAVLAHPLLSQPAPGSPTRANQKTGDSKRARLLDLRSGPVLPTPDPRLRVLEAFPDQFRAVSITLNELA